MLLADIPDSKESPCGATKSGNSPAAFARSNSAAMLLLLGVSSIGSASTNADPVPISYPSLSQLATAALAAT